MPRSCPCACFIGGWVCCGVDRGVGCTCVVVDVVIRVGVVCRLCPPPPPPSPSLAMVSIVGFKVWGVLNDACYAFSCFVFGLCGATRCDWCAAHQSCCVADICVRVWWRWCWPQGAWWLHAHTLTCMHPCALLSIKSLCCSHGCRVGVWWCML